MYEIINPITKHREIFENISDANTFLNKEIIKHSETLFSDKYNIEIEKEVNICKQFLEQKGYINETIYYVHSVYNANQKQIISRVYYITPNKNQRIFVKVANNSVIEYYQLVANDSEYIAEALDLKTNEAIEYYKFADTTNQIIKFSDVDFNLDNLIFQSHSLLKYSANDEYIVTTYNVYSFADMTNEERSALEDFEYKEHIIQKKYQTYGFVVHFVEQVYLPYSYEEKIEWGKNFGFFVNEY